MPHALILFCCLFFAQAIEYRTFEGVEYSFLTTAITYDHYDAVKVCISLGGSLLIPKTKKVQKFLVEYFKTIVLPDPPYSFVCGLFVIDYDATLVRMEDGSYMLPKNYNWAPTHPHRDKPYVLLGSSLVRDDQLLFRTTDFSDDNSVAHIACEKPAPATTPAPTESTPAPVEVEEPEIDIEGSFETDAMEIEQAEIGSSLILIISISGGGVLFLICLLLGLYLHRKNLAKKRAMKRKAKRKAKRRKNNPNQIDDDDDDDDDYSDDDDDSDDAKESKFTGYNVEKAFGKMTAGPHASVVSLYNSAKSRVNMAANSTKRRVSLYFHSQPTDNQAKTVDTSIVKGLRGYRGGE